MTGTTLIIRYLDDDKQVKTHFYSNPPYIDEAKLVTLCKGILVEAEVTYKRIVEVARLNVTFSEADQAMALLANSSEIENILDTNR